MKRAPVGHIEELTGVVAQIKQISLGKSAASVPIVVKEDFCADRLSHIQAVGLETLMTFSAPGVEYFASISGLEEKPPLANTTPPFA